ncbi:hypothetical protein [Spongiactinospora sp. TRM90649]|uniref:hypothetical protein n=1 Tax=Spongiactinospora sp. TRM90649 TaxID=3031114 RepID=UPI0023F7D9D9|nr:hypothetical protein [Spongiactinospora sp. TRM90649]MDF5757789.1 hypothetical protein [Spongiactinospora sp. TRM90649]
MRTTWPRVAIGGVAAVAVAGATVLAVAGSGSTVEITAGLTANDRVVLPASVTGFPDPSFPTG